MQEAIFLLSCRRLILVYSDPKKAGSTLAILDGDQLQELSTPYSSFGSLSVGNTGERLMFLAS